jgi:hypothetical protein
MWNLYHFVVPAVHFSFDFSRTLATAGEIMKKLAKSSPRKKKKWERKTNKKNAVHGGRAERSYSHHHHHRRVFIFPTATTPAEQILFYSLLLSLFGSHAVTVTVTLYTRLTLALSSPRSSTLSMHKAQAHHRHVIVSAAKSLSILLLLLWCASLTVQYKKEEVNRHVVQRISHGEKGKERKIKK